MVGWDMERHFVVPPPLGKEDFDLESTKKFKSTSMINNRNIGIQDAVSALDEYAKGTKGKIDADEVSWALPSKEVQNQFGYYFTESATSFVMVCDQGVFAAARLDEEG